MKRRWIPLTEGRDPVAEGAHWVREFSCEDQGPDRRQTLLLKGSVPGLWHGQVDSPEGSVDALSIPRTDPVEHGRDDCAPKTGKTFFDLLSTAHPAPPTRFFGNRSFMQAENPASQPQKSRPTSKGIYLTDSGIAMFPVTNHQTTNLQNEMKTRLTRAPCQTPAIRIQASTESRNGSVDVRTGER